MARRYCEEIHVLHIALSKQQSGEAKEHVRALRVKIVLTPCAVQDDLTFDLHGCQASILRIATEDKTMKHKINIEKILEGIALATSKEASSQFNW